jgi:hypothetical protein
MTSAATQSGILVDIIQEWNRYSVFKDFDREPIQGTARAS